MSDAGYPPTVDGQPLSEEQKAAFDAFRAEIHQFTTKQTVKLLEVSAIFAAMEATNDPNLPKARQLLRELEEEMRLFGIDPGAGRS